MSRPSIAPVRRRRGRAIAAAGVTSLVISLSMAAPGVPPSLAPPSALAETAAAHSPLERQAQDYCRAMAARFDVASRFDRSGAGPQLLASYGSAANSAPEHPAVAGAAFVYDNALAAIAFLACGRRLEARRLADALLAAVRHDRFYADGRIRNAYRAGPVTGSAPVVHVWWDAAARRTVEDGYQVGTHTGNAAWVALALLAVWHDTGDAAYRDGAARLMTWVASLGCDGHDASGGIAGGFEGH